MRPHLRAFVVLLLALLLLGLFFRNVDVRGVVRSIAGAHPGWLALALCSMVANLAIRAWRWQYLLEPLGRATFANAFRATAVGFAARSVLPAAAGELVRPYFLARRERVSATAAFATVILERLLDLLTVLVLLAAYVFVFGRGATAANPAAMAAVAWSGGVAAAGSLAGLAVLFVLAGNPARLGQTLARLGQVLPSALVSLLARVAERFATGLGAIRRPSRLLVALAWSLPLWLCIAFGIWAVAVAFRLPIPFPGSFLVMGLLTIGVAVPTPGSVGGFHEAFRVAATVFFGSPNEAAVGSAIVLHALSFGPAIVLGLLFAAEEGLNVSAMRRLAEETGPGPAA
jgi:hypothetical protein